MVGAFFYIKSKELNFSDFLARPVSLEDAEEYGNMLTSSLGHAEIFDQKFPHCSIEYFSFPRGRIVYDQTEKYHIIYVDTCLNKTTIIKKIKALFKIPLDELCPVKPDSHYVCDACIDYDSLWS